MIKTSELQLKMDKLIKSFKLDLERICGELISLAAKKCNHAQEELADGQCLGIWFDFCKQYIKPKARKVKFCNGLLKEIPLNFPSKSEEIIRCLDKLKNSIQVGEDINVYQSKGLIRNMFIKNVDRFYTDYKLHHLHLSESTGNKNSYFSERSDYYVICLVENEEVTIIDIISHLRGDQFSCPSYLKKLQESYPEKMACHQLKSKNMNGSKTTSDKKPIHNLRNSGYNSTLIISGVAYAPPGLGVTSNNITLRSVVDIRIIHNALDALVENIFESEYKAAFIKHNILNPNLKLEIMDQNGLVLYEKKSKISFSLPVSLRALLLPNWVIKEVL